MLRNGLPLLAVLLLSACSKPSFMGDKVRSDPSFLGLESQSAPTLALSSQEDYPELQSDIDSILSSYGAPPPVSISATPSASSVYIPSPDIGTYAQNDVSSYSAPAALPALQDDVDKGEENSPGSRAHAYLKALFRGDGEGAWKYATVLANPRQSWWDSNTAKGALLMKAGSSEYFAGQKQGVSRIDIPANAIQLQGNDARLIAQITYGNGSRSNMNLRLINERGQWLVAEE